MLEFLFKFGEKQINIYSVGSSNYAKSDLGNLYLVMVGVRPRREIALVAAGHFTLGAVFACVCIYMRSKSLCLRAAAGCVQSERWRYKRGERRAQRRVAFATQRHFIKRVGFRLMKIDRPW